MDDVMNNLIFGSRLNLSHLTFVRPRLCIKLTWNMTVFSVAEIYWHFGWTYSFCHVPWMFNHCVSTKCWQISPTYEETVFFDYILDSNHLLPW